MLSHSVILGHLQASPFQSVAPLGDKAIFKQGREMIKTLPVIQLSAVTKCRKQSRLSAKECPCVDSVPEVSLHPTGRHGEESQAARLTAAERPTQRCLTWRCSFRLQIMLERRLLLMLCAIREMDKEGIMRKLVQVKRSLVQGKHTGRVLVTMAP